MHRYLPEGVPVAAAAAETPAAPRESGDPLLSAPVDTCNAEKKAQDNQSREIINTYRVVTRPIV